MNKTTTANIGGIVFHIDVDAYDKLQNYLNAIGKYFDKSEGKDEIMADIETRIAELLKERKSDPDQVIVMEDVDTVIKTMGEPEQYADPAAEDEYEQGSRRHSSSHTYQRRRLFRDPDNRHLGGVCSGIANYFGFDPVWLRIFFLIAFFGWGTGLLLYIILWIVIPEAKTTAEKLEMKGEPINVDNIGKTIDDEMNKMKEQLNNIAERTKNMDTKKAANNFAEGVESIFQFFVNIFTAIFQFLGKVIVTVLKVLGRIIGIVFVIAGLLLLTFLIATLFNASSVLSITSEGFHYYSLHQWFSYISASSTHWILIIIAGILFIGIPVLAVIYGGIRLLFPSRSNINTRGTGLIFFSLWLIGLIIAAVLAFQIGMEFKNESRVVEDVEMEPFYGDILYIDMNKGLFKDALDDTFDDKYSFQLKVDNDEIELLRFGNLLFQPDGNDHFVGIPKLNVLKSNTNEVQMQFQKFADGVTSRQAESRARSIKYHFDQNDSTIIFDPVFRIEDELLFRDQTLKIELRIPENTIVEFSESTELILYNLGNLSVKWLDQSYDHWYWKLRGHKWMMINDGLTCLDCEDSSDNLLDSLQLERVRAIGL